MGLGRRIDREFLFQFVRERKSLRYASRMVEIYSSNESNRCFSHFYHSVRDDRHVEHVDHLQVRSIRPFVGTQQRAVVRLRSAQPSRTSFASIQIPSTHHENVIDNFHGLSSAQHADAFAEDLLFLRFQRQNV